jgi:hypothetical protein
MTQGRQKNARIVWDTHVTDDADELGSRIYSSEALDV